MKLFSIALSAILLPAAAGEDMPIYGGSRIAINPQASVDPACPNALDITTGSIEVAIYDQLFLDDLIVDAANLRLIELSTDISVEVYETRGEFKCDKASLDGNDGFNGFVCQFEINGELADELDRVVGDFNYSGTAVPMVDFALKNSSTGEMSKVAETCLIRG